MIRWILALLALLSVGVLIVWRLPLSFVAARVVPDLTATEMTGTIWKGRLTDAAWRGTRLGDLDVELDPRALLSGKVRIDFVRLASRVSGRFGVGEGVNRLENVNGIVAMPLSVSFANSVDIALIGADLTVDNAGRCLAAGGEVATVMTGVPLIGTTPELRGTLACDQGWIRLPLASVDESIGLDVRVAANRQYRADISVRARALPVRLALAAAGFELGDGRATLAVAGQL